MKMCLIIAALALSALLSRPVCAAGAASGVTIVDVRIDSTGKGVVFFSANLTGNPSCVQSGYGNGLAFDANTAGGKAILAFALSAQATGLHMSVFGLGTCSVYGNYVEDWNYGES
ncbi:MAG TPA: hypothetical protein VJQ82_06585 [Terriglobales bacterium]|nr:hypothetical protein [Terriglobales bacterium]